ncbi:glycoside hydrolase family 99-like domain-containing protein [Mangrovimicrobium sediminis]|uniref:glycoside hydrolase family 99-like domain-containing protein n=1 Tax=Mangrovimicrobium sediminis TaxID=2562682 RepID=UPI00143696D6|nr:glycoside hydrolase family 99-like domain-containing protein [Haliea sp. SAOS-164]
MTRETDGFICPIFRSHWSGGERATVASEFALSAMDAPDSRTRTLDKLDRPCIEASNPMGAPWLYMCLPVAAQMLGSRLSIEVTLYCDFDASLWLEYDSEDDSVDIVPGQPGAFKRTPSQAVSNSNDFVTFEFQIDDARHTRRTNGADFRVVADRPTDTAIVIADVLVRQGAQDCGRKASDRAAQLHFERPGNPCCSIVIPMHNRVEYTLQCLYHLQRNTPAGYEIIIVDDGSQASDRDLLRLVTGVEIVDTGSCQGFARACHAGALRARSEHLLFLNNDTIPMSGWLQPMLDTLEQHAQVGVVGSRLVFPGNALVQHAGIAFDRHGLPYHLGLGRPREDAMVSDDRVVAAVTGACLLTRRALFLELDGFDTGYRNGFEDVDYCLRAGERGLLTVYCARSQLYHYESITEGRIDYLRETANRNRFHTRWLATACTEATDQSRTNAAVGAEAGEGEPGVIAFHRPEFHRGPGRGWLWRRENPLWAKVRSAKPLYPGHQQPRQPLEEDRNSQTDRDVQRVQADLARQFGIRGFCYYLNWRDGQRRLERPLRPLLAQAGMDFPFCVCWQNDGTTGGEGSADSERVTGCQRRQNIDPALVDALLPLLADPRYLRVDGRPLLLVERASALAGTVATSAHLRTACRGAGVGEILLAACSRAVDEPLPPGFDLAVEMPPGEHPAPIVNDQLSATCAGFRGEIFDYYHYAKDRIEEPPTRHPRYRTAMLAWDETPQRAQAARIFHGFTPGVYSYWLASLLREAGANAGPHAPLVFVNAWNDWAAGAYLQADEACGQQNLQATRDAITTAAGTGSVLAGSRLYRVIGGHESRLLPAAPGEPASPQVDGDPGGLRRRYRLENSLSSPAAEIAADGDSVALVIHAYYLDVFAQLLEYLRTIRSVSFCLYVTTVDEHVGEIRRQLEASGIASFRIYPCENRGRDLLPFLGVLPDIVAAGHAYVVKGHTKKSHHREDGTLWRQELFDALFESVSLGKGLQQLLMRPQLGVLGPDRHLAPMREFMAKNASKVGEIGAALGIDVERMLAAHFVAGTMFIARVDALKPLLELGFSRADFEVEAGQVDGTLAHALERAISLSALSAGYEVASFSGRVTGQYAIVAQAGCAGSQGAVPDGASLDVAGPDEAGPEEADPEEARPARDTASGHVSR